MYQLQWCMLDAERRMHGFTKFQRQKKIQAHRIMLFFFLLKKYLPGS